MFMIKLHRRIFSFQFLMLSALVLFQGFPALAQDNKEVWEYHRSVTNSFEARFPRDYKMKSSPLRINDETVLFQNEIVAVTDTDSANPKNAKTFVVTVDQTLGKTLSSKKVRALLNRDVLKYKKAAAASGGHFVSALDIDDRGFAGKEIYITYGDEEDEYRQGLRVRVWYTDITRVEMIVSGPAKALYGFTVKKFFESLQLYDGFAAIKGKVGENWASYPSKFDMFTIKAPAAENEYVFQAPKFVAVNKGLERGRMTFIDPILGRKVIFDFYGYKIKERLDYDTVTTLLYSQHVSKYAKTMRREDLKVDQDRTDKYGILTTNLVMRPLEKRPYISAGVIRALFNDNGVLVMEFLGSPDVVDTTLAESLFSQVLFHPERAYVTRKKNESEDPQQSEGDDESTEDESALLDDISEDDGADDAGEDVSLDEDMSADDAGEDEGVEGVDVDGAEVEKPAEEMSEAEEGDVEPEAKKPSEEMSEAEEGDVEPEAKKPAEEMSEAEDGDAESAPPTGIPADAMPKVKGSSDEEAPVVNFGSGQ